MNVHESLRHFTLVELLCERARDLNHADRLAFTHLGDGENITGAISFAGLDFRARQLAAHLQESCVAGERVLLAFPPGIDYIAAFFACAYAGAIAVPALPPANARTLPRLRLIAHDAQPRIALAPASVVEHVRRLQDGADDALGRLAWLAADTLGTPARDWIPPDRGVSDVVFLQYTSGSTSAPKGVMVTHANILANLALMQSAFGMRPDDAFVSWLPPHHDMGLIGTILYPLYVGSHCVQITPAAFLARPYRWLKALSDYRARFTAAPNFAYDLCVDKVTAEQKAGLDLGALDYACNGAEPVRAGTIRRFSESFAACGFRPDALLPVYGLAEATLMVTSSSRSGSRPIDQVLRLDADALGMGEARIDANATRSTELASVGLAVSAGHHVAIVDPVGLDRVADGRIGEVWVHGASVAQGYWNRIEESAHAFAARLPGESKSYLRTGDLGFIRNANLYIAGRIKDVMIFNGRNVYPQDIEATVEALHPAFRANGCAAFSIEGDDRVSLVLVMEVEARKSVELDALIPRLRAEIAGQHEVIDIAAVVLVKAGHIPRTSSGKIQRSQCRRMFLDGAFAALQSWRNDRSPLHADDATWLAPASETERRLAAIWESLLDCRSLSVNDDFFAAGGHSLLVVQIAARIRAEFALEMPLEVLFEAPTIAALAKWIEASRLHAAPLTTIERAPREERARLSSSQQRLWFVEQVDRAAGIAHHIPAGLHIEGPLDRVALQAALAGVIARHEILRTTFVATDGEPLQVVAPPSGEFQWIEHDLCTLASGERSEAIDAIIALEANAPFDLVAGPLIRGRLLRIGDDAHILLVTQHHIVSDGWSIGVLMQEIRSLYTAHASGQPDPLQPLAIQYADYAAWQREQLRGDALHAQVEYWRTRLAGAEPLELPLDRPRPAAQSYRGGRVQLEVPRDCLPALRQLSQRHGATLFMTLLGAWSTLLARLSGQQDIVVGAPVAGRHRSEVESLVGFFVNTLALRIDTAGNPTVAQLLQQVRTTTLEAYARQDVPFEEVVKAIRPQRSLDRSPVFQTMFAFNNTPNAGGFDLPGLAVRPLDIAHDATQFDLTLSLTDRHDAIVGHLEFATDLFDRGTIERYARHFVVLLLGFVADDALGVDALPLLERSERDELLVDFNATDAQWPHESLLHELVEEQAVAHPEAVAVACGTRSLTYRELDQHANRLAHRLVALGVKPDRRVAICVERGVDMIMGVLAILKAGGAYVPLDPAYPHERLAFMLADSSPVALLTQSALRERLPVGDGVAVIELDGAATTTALREAPSGAPVPNTIGLTPSHLAYVIYTSGSTGQPKGVMVEHRHAVASTWARRETYDARADDRFLLLSSLAFDSSVAGIFMTLATGGALHIADGDLATDPRAIARTLLDEDITSLLCVPSLAQLVLAQLSATGDAGNLRRAIVAGESCPPALARNLAAFAPAIALYNEYGPTEATVWCTVHRCDAVDRPRMPIGTPIANARIYILDARDQPVPIGVAGEIHVGGAGVARGYLDRPELTEQRFVRDPFGTSVRARMYRTGDIGRWLPNGSIEYLGRNDHQVKIRGFRVELGEIEAKLGACEGVRDAVVVAREDAPGDQRLVAYVVPSADRLPVAALRAVVAGALPEHMVPAAFVQLDAFPLTPNGKLDRKALPAPDASALPTRAYEPPQGEVETAIAQIWQDLLGLERVGRHDRFFELGGHSLLVVGMIERLRQQGLAADVRTVFAAPTLAALATAIGGEHEPVFVAPPNLITEDCGSIGPELLPLVELTRAEIDFIVANVPGGVANVQDVYPLAPLQEGILFHHLLETKGDAYLHRTVIAFDAKPRLDAFVDALLRVIERHDILRTAVHWQGLSRPVQVVHRHAPMPVVELEPADDALARLLALTDPRTHRMDLTRAPLIAATASEDRVSGEWLLAVMSHHLVDDNYTLQRVLGEVHVLLEGRGDALPEALPYRNFIAQLHSVPVAVHEAYFRERLASVDTPTAPFGVLDVQGDGTDVAETREPLDHQLAQDVRKTARQHGVTPAVLFHAAWAQVLAACCGLDEVVFGTTLSGRLQGTEGADRVLGMFINTLPIRIELKGRSASELLDETYRNLGGLLAHEQASLALAQRCSGVPAPLPLFTSLLNYRHTDLESGANACWPGMRLLHDQERTNYPLTVSIDDRGDGFQIVAQCANGIAPARVVGYLHTAISGLVEAMAVEPGRPVLTLPVLPYAERQQVLVHFNATGIECAGGQLLHQGLEAGASTHPDAVAVVFEGQSLTYGELNSRANRLAHRLIASGVEPDARIAICVERGLEMIVGLLAILKSGGAYVPLDPAYPQERLAFMLADSAPVALLTQAGLRDRLQPAVDLATIVLDEPSESTLTDASDRDPDPQAIGLASGHLAYIIYTSGSTGQPKGVAIEHRNATNLIAWALQKFSRDELRNSLFSTSINFDLAVFELFVPLASGETVVLAKNVLAQFADPTLVNTVPSAITALLDAQGVPDATRMVNLAGEPLKRELVERIFASTHAQAVANLYGPSETTTYSTWVRMDRNVGFASHIGRPIANTQVYILDAHGRPTPIGVAGEIHIGGAGVARGYLFRPELTAQRFVRDPFSGSPAARMYRTGDLGRWLPEGNIEYLGRNDFQVKIRGFRIELGEIEARLCACEGVCEAIVVAREDVPGDRRLVAYLVPKSQELSVATLRSELAAQLPEHMLPRAFVQLARFPLTPNGKLDRKALPAPDASAVLARAFEAPQGPVETAIAGIWQDLLGLESVGRHDHFFELGGHSLLVVSLIERLRQQGLTADVRSVFALPTLAALAHSICGEHAPSFEVPPNRIDADCTAISPDLLPLVGLTQDQIDGIVAYVPGGVANVQDIYPLSPLQEGILFHHLLETKGDAYLLRTVIAFDSRLRMDAFVAALQRVIDRHDILRSAVRWQDLAQPVQIVHRHASMPVFELAPSDDPVAGLLAATDPRAARMDLRRAPLLSATIAEDRASGECLLSVLSHHLMCDHVTVEWILAEVQEILLGNPDLPPALPYRNFIARVHATPVGVHEAYFREQLSSVDAPTAPFGVLDVKGDGADIVEAHEFLDPALATRVRTAARQHGVTPAVIFHAAWAQVLAACSGRDDVVFGTTLSGRLQGSEGADRVLGMFINTLPIRIALKDRSATELLADTYRNLGGLLEHEQASLALAQRCSGVVAPLPLFTSLLNYRHSRLTSGAHPAWQGMRLLHDQERTNYPLTMSIDDRGEAFVLIAQCTTSMAPERILGYLRTALEGLVDALAMLPAQPVLALPVVPSDEIRRVLFDFNATAVDYPRDRLLHQLVEDQAAAHPDAIAVVFEEQSLSYGEINRRANRLAHRLIALGVRPDARVAICVERSLQMVVGLLAILKAGGAYVPLDPAYPDERLACMLADCAPVALLTQASLRERLQAFADLSVLQLDGPGMVMAADEAPDRNPDPRALGLTADHLAYVIYTSGSTGQPKGVAMPQRALLNLLQWQRQTGLDQATKTLQFAALGFDVAFQEIFSTLCAGGCLVLINEQLRQDPSALVEHIAQQRVERLFLPFIALQNLAEAASRSHADLSQLKTVVTAGEQLRIGPAIRRMFENIPGCRLHNHYGPTESHVVTAHTLPGNVADWIALPPIGTPIANNRIHILDARLQPVPIGVAGEIHVSGAGVACGYLNRPELTAGKFIRDPFHTDPEARMYRTSDLGRWLADGSIEYLGRNDFQVKVRGFRIELGEIEARLCACEGVREAVVIAREDVPGDQRLVAYVLTEDTELSVATLRSELAEVLPEHMLPSAFVRLDAFPLTPNGKLDRRALPVPDQSAVLARMYEAPQGPVESCIAAIWQDLLHLDRVGRNDHFFELGGHSLLVVGLIERLRQAGLHASVRNVFDAPTVKALAARLGDGVLVATPFVVPPNRIADDCVAITPELLPLIELSQDEIDTIVVSVPDGAANIQDIYPLAPLQEGILFHHLLETQGDAYLLRFMFSFDTRTRLDAFVAALQQVIHRHDILRSAIRWKGLRQPVQVVHRRASMPLVELPSMPDARAALAERTDPRRTRLDLALAPVLCATAAHDQGSGSWLLALHCHHIVTDHMSLALIAEEIRVIVEGHAERLPLPLPYRGFVAQAHADEPTVHSAYFREQLAAVDEPTAPFGILDIQGDGGRVDESVIELDPALSQRLRACARQRGVSAAVLFHVAWARVVAQCSGRDDVVFGTTLSGRLQGSEGADRVLGMFINTLPVRIALGDRDAENAVANMYQRLGELLDHEQAPLALAQRCSAVVAPTPLFTTLFNFRHTDPDALTSLQGVELLGVEDRTNYPITVSVDDLGEGFTLIVQCVAGIDATRVGAYLATTLASLVDALASDSAAPLLSLPMLPEAERTLLLGANAAVASPCEGRIHRLFEQQARVRPAAVALVLDGASMAYGDLNARANRLAHRLLALGVRPDTRVAICVERGFDMVVGLLAILKAGGAYVPIDPAYPSERLAFMLADSAPVALLTQAWLRDRVQAPAGVPVLVLDDPQTVLALAAAPGHDPDADAMGLASTHLAYVIYTSGSTGQPKGVMVEHGHVARLFAATQQDFYFDDTDVWTLFHSFAFDFSVWEIFGALLHGGRLVIVPSLCARTPAEFHELLCRERVTVLNQTPSAFRQLIGAQAASDQAHALRCIVFGGEALELHTLIPWIARNDPQHTQLVNMYGITEITVHATYRALSAADVDARLGSVIGRPLADLRLYILDRHQQPVPIGVAGEIHIGGAGVARGYLHRPELTAQRFVRDPFAASDARMYRTGDLGRWLADGSVEYLGRNDFQVKIRGFRIELGEIEARLCACEGVREAVVIAREDQPGDRRLVAYLVPAAGEVSVAALREELAATLPEHMVPGAFVQLDAFPLTPNGKLDRKALPAPDASAVLARTYEAPHGPVETAIATIWQALLGLDRVGRHDHFFELGGHSLRVVSLIERLRQQGLTADVRSVFANPTLAALATVIGGEQQPAFVVPPQRITADCTAITPDLLPLVALSQPEIDTLVAGVPGGAANVQDIYPLAPLQEGILFHHLLETKGDAYLLRTVIAFDRRARMEAFVSALQRVIDRHDILRSAVRWQGLGQPVQVVHRHAPMAVVELEPADDPLAQLQAITDPRNIRMDLTRAPLIAATVVADRTSGEWLMALLSHHLIDDNYTMQLVLAEVRTLLDGRGHELPPALPYRNFIARLRAVPEAVHEAYFREQLSTVDAPTAPFGVLDVQGDGAQIVEAHATLDPIVAQRVRAAARQHGVTPAVLFHAAWAQVLAACSDRDDVVFGTTLSGRLQGSEGADRVLGMFINTLPIRVTLNQRNARQLVDDTYRNLSGLLAHEQASLALAQRCSGVAAPLPLFTSLLNYRHTRLLSDAAPAWDGMRLLHDQERTNFPLTVSIDDRGQDFGLIAQCANGIVPERILGFLRTALEGLVDALAQQPQRAVLELPVLPDDERQLLVDFNATAVDYPRDRLLHQLVEDQAAAHPDAIAVVFEEQSLSYGEINRRANRLAHRLIALGVRPDARVAICVERSLQMVVGLLAILKAGGAYVPLDPAYPDERLACMLADCAPVALLTQVSLRERLQAFADLSVLQLDGPGMVMAADEAPDRNPDPRALGLTADHLAYVIYTSGSTGQPKGVAMPQRALLNLLQWQRQTGLDQATKTLQFAALGFDVAFQEIFSTLCAGGCLVLINEQLRQDPSALVEHIAQQRVERLFLPFIALQNLAEAASRSHADLSQLKTVVTAGEQLRIGPAIRRMFENIPGCRLHNHYGPTESHVVTAHTLPGNVADWIALPPIGTPIANNRIHILDARLQPVPIGVAGEIHVSGAGVACGYLNRPELTAGKFIRDPFHTDPEARMYRTSDLGRWLADGSIEYLGRNDFQVKVRGFRIELGEIEARLCACEGVREAVVIAREDVPGDQRLVAYVLTEDTELSVATLRSELAEVLPEHMLPSAFVRLDAFPLTPNGKLDRRALPVPDQSAVLARMYEAPQGPVESCIAAIWQDLLHLDRVGRNDHFFELGGHSLLAVQMSVRLREAFDIDVPLRSLFEQPVLSQVSDAIVSQQLTQFSDEDIAMLEKELESFSEADLLASLSGCSEDA